MMIKHLTVFTAFLMMVGGAVAADEGKYSIAAGKTAFKGEGIVFILDAETGKLRYCFVLELIPSPEYVDTNLRCGPWVDPE